MLFRDMSGSHEKGSLLRSSLRCPQIPRTTSQHAAGSAVLHFFLEQLSIFTKPPGGVHPCMKCRCLFVHPKMTPIYIIDG